MAFKTQDDIVRWYKNFDSAGAYGKTDEDVYNLASQYTKNTFGKSLKAYIPKVAPTSVEGIPIRPMGDTKDPLASAKTSPDDIKGLAGIAASIGTTGLSGWMAEYLPEGLDLPGESFDISPEFFQQSYNNSLAGQLYQSIYGEPAYKVEDYDPSWVSEAGQFMVGMFNVPEAAAFMTGSRLGLWGARNAAGALHKYSMLGVNASAKTKALSSRAMSTAMVESGLETGIALGTLGAAHSSASSAAQQRVDPEGDGTISIRKTMMDGAKGFAESFLIGAPAGAVAKGFLGSKYAMAKLASDDKTLDMATKAMYGLPSQIGTEALAFTTFPNLYKSVGLGFEDYPTIGSEEWNQGLFQNTVVIGTMGGFGKLAREAKGIDESYVWAQKLLQQSVRDVKQLRDSAENVKSSMAESGVKINPDMLKLISDSNQGVVLEPQMYDKFIKDQAIVNTIIKKDPSKWTEVERKQLQNTLLPTKLVELGLWRELEQNEGSFRNILEEIQGREITDTEFNTYSKALDAQIKQTVNTFNDMNEALTGFNATSGTKTVDPTFKPVKMTKDTGLLKPDGSPYIKTEIAQSATQSADLLRRGYAEEGVVPLAPGQGKIESPQEISKGSSSIAEMEAALERRGLGYDRITEAKKAEELILEEASKVFEYIEKKQTKTSSNQKFIDDRTKQMSNVKVDSVTGTLVDTNAVISYGLFHKGGKKLYRTYSKKVADYVDWLHSHKKKSIKDSNAEDVHEFIADVIMKRENKNKIDPKDMSPYSTFYEYIHEKFHGDGLLVQKNISYEEANALRRLRITGPEGGVDTKLLKSVDKRVDKVISELEQTLGQSASFKENAVLAKLLKYGIRDQEINLIQKENIRFSDAEGWYIDFGVGKDVPFISKRAKGDTLPTVIPIPERLAKQILELEKPGKKLLFPHDSKIGNVANKKKIAQLIFGKDYDWDLSRTILKTKAVDKGIPSEQMAIYMRNEKGVGREIYTKEQVDNLLKRHKEIQKKLGIEGEAKYQLEGIGPPESARTLSPWLENQIKRNLGLKLNKLKDADFVGRFYEGVIDITMGKANKFTFFHENAHRLKAMIDASGNTRLKKAWKQAENLFKNDAKKANRDLEEFIADEIAGYGMKREQPASIKGKMKGWADRFWSTVKSVFFGKENLTKNDVKNLLGEKVYKGFAFNTNARATSIAKYKWGTVEDVSRGVKNEFDRAIDNAGLNISGKEKSALVKYIAESAGIEDAAAFRLGKIEMGEEKMMKFSQALSVLPFTEMRGITNLVEKTGIIRNIERVAPKLFSPDTQQNIMKLLGFKKNTLWGASLGELKAYQEIVNTTRMPKQERVAGIAESATSGELAESMAKLDGVLGDAAKVGLPVGLIIKKLGAKKIANNLENHIDAELHHMGQFILFEDNAMAEIGKRQWNGSFGKAVKDSMYLIDVERYIERKNEGLIKKYEQNFIDKAFKSDWVIEKDGKLIKNPNYKQLRKALNLSNPEGRVVDKWIDYTDYVHEAFNTSVKANLSETEWLNFKEQNNIKWIKDGIYVSRILTPEFKRKFNIGGKYFQKLVDEQAAPLARELAKEKYNTNKPTDEQIGSMIEDAQQFVYADLNDLFNFSKGKHSTRFLKPRHTKLPEFVKIDGKKIQVYQNKYEDTLKPYALGMSKFMANVEIFPEYVNIKGFDFPGVQAELGKLKTSNPKWGEWIQTQVEKQLGIGKNFTDYGDTFSKGLSNTAQFLAKTQLSFPTSGLKNLILGQGATLQAFRTTEWFRAIGRTMSKEFRNEVKGTGGTEIGLRSIEDLRVSPYLDKVFWFGGMKPSENFNRYVSVAASKIEQQRFADILRNPKSSQKKIVKVERKLKDFYGLNKDQIALLKKYGTGGVDDVSFTSSYEKTKESRAVNKVYQKMNTMAHIKTQGASVSYFMPEWADNKYLRPMTLFKRMAYASTTNTLNNAKIAWKNGDYMKLGWTALGPYLTGQALMSVYDLLFDENPPKENSDWGTHFKHTLIRGESLGVLSDFLRMYEGESAEFTMYPAVYNFFDLAFLQTAKPLLKGTKTVDQAGHDLFTGVFGGYRAYRKIIDNKQNPFNSKMRKYRKLYYEFLDEKFPDAGEDFTIEKRLRNRDKYYRDFKESFYKEDIKNFTKHAIVMTYAVATDLYNENLTAEGQPTKYKSQEEALKQAISILKTKLKVLNPNPGNFLREDKSKSVEWMNWLAKDKDRAKVYYKELNTVEKEYYHKLRQFYKLFPSMIQSPEIRKLIKHEMGRLK
jgi:hypothetical protein